MGRTSKFHFGRKQTASTEQLAPTPVKPHGSPGAPQLSKAQRLLGTGGDLNIDYPKADDDFAWSAPKPRKQSDAAVSIAISEPDRKNGRRNKGNEWDAESEAPRRVAKKDSSTLLAPKYGDYDSVSLDGRLQNQKISSISHKTIGQQPNHSAQDLSLRKRNGSGTAPRSPLLHVDYVDDWGEPTEDNNAETPFVVVPQTERARKKPSRLDLSKLFPRGRKDSASTALSTSTTVSTPDTALIIEGHSEGKSPGSVRNGRLRTQESGLSLRRTESRESGKSGISTQTAPARQRVQRSHTLSSDYLHNSYDHYEKEPNEPVPPLPYIKSGAPESIPESRAVERQQPTRKSSHGQMLETPQHSTGSSRNLSSKGSKSALSNRSRNGSIPTPWSDTRSVASASSRNTKTSGKSKNSGSIPAGVDLNKQSVLSFESSDDEDVQSEPENVSKILDNPLLGFPAPPSAGPTGALPPIPTKAKHEDDAYRRKRSSVISTTSKRSAKSTKSTPEDTRSKQRYSKLPALPLPPAIDARLSGPWAISFPMPDALLDATPSNPEPASKPLRSTRSDTTHAFQPTPPLSPTSIEFHQDPDRSSRFMAVTQQEEALLEALRQKRARMRESRISEADSELSVDPMPQTRRPSQSSRRSSRASRASKASMASMAKSRTNQHESVLLFLDDPIMEGENEHEFDNGELDDFYYNSEDDHTPRASYQTAKQVDVAILKPSVYRRSKADGPVTPPDASRISNGTGTFGDLKGLKRELEEEISNHGGLPPMVAGQEALVNQILSEGFGDEELDPIWGR